MKDYRVLGPCILYTWRYGRGDILRVILNYKPSHQLLGDHTAQWVINIWIYGRKCSVVLFRYEYFISLPHIHFLFFINFFFYIFFLSTTRDLSGPPPLLCAQKISPILLILLHLERKMSSLSYIFFFSSPNFPHYTLSFSFLFLFPNFVSPFLHFLVFYYHCMYHCYTRELL